MRYLILILCLLQFRVEANDWLNRTVRVDLIVGSSHRAYDPRFDKLEQVESISNGVNATNGQYPWSIFTTAWLDLGSGSRIGTPCAGTIISSNFVLSDFYCVGQHFIPIANSIEIYMGSVELSSFTPTNFVRTYWHIEQSPANSPNIVLFRLNQTLTFNPNVQPIRLPIYENFSYEGWSSVILGFGLLSSSPTVRRLQSAQAGILINNFCHFGSIGGIADHEICGIESEPSQSDPVIRFNGFTGGAWIVYEYTDAGLEYSPVLIGIHQYQFANHTASYGLATRVSPFVEWVETLTTEDEENKRILH